MIYILLSVLCSVSVGVLLKIARKYDVDFIQVVTLNYVSAIFLCFFSYQPDLSDLSTNAPWHIYLPLGFLLPTVFFLLAKSIQYMGIVKTDIAQRLSLFIPILASVFLFGEQFILLKIIGLVIGFIAIFLILHKQETFKENSNKWIFPAMVLLGFGIADVLFKTIATQTEIPYTTSLFVVFCAALAVAILFSAYSIIEKKRPFSFLNVAFGLFLGMLNFGNILFYLMAHKALSSNPSTVFASMNLGVIVLGTLVGIFAFKEKVSVKNYAGILLAITSIVLITISQLS